MRTRDEYVAGMKKQLDVWNANVELARYNLRLIEKASLSAWTELCDGADEAWDRMRQAADAAGGYFEKLPAKAAPKRAAKPRAAKRG